VRKMKWTKKVAYYLISAGTLIAMILANWKWV